MQRDISKLSSEPFDVLIVGAGIYGATAAWDAATRGLSTALIDQGDFGGATSSNSLKIVHGGLRYLQQLDIKRMRESIRERRMFMQMAPHLVHPLSCIMPTYGHLVKGPEMMYVGMLLNDMISYDRNKLADPQKYIPAGKVISRDDCLRLVPGVNPDGINGGVLWTDAQTFNSERLILAFIMSAVFSGAQAANYVRAENFLSHNGRIYGVQAKDLIHGKSFEIRSKVVVNMAGGWTDTLLSTLGKPSSRVRLSTAMNVIVNRPLLTECAAGVRGRFEYPLRNGGSYKGYRVLFITPWRNSTIIGTYHRPYQGSPDDLRVAEEDIEAFLKEINSAYPGDPVKRDHVALVHKGFLPMNGIHHKTGDVMLTKHYNIYDHAKEEHLSGMISTVGVKYTTARDVSEKVIDRVFPLLGKKLEPNRTRHLHVIGGDIERFEEMLSIIEVNPPQGLTPRVMSHLVKNYGTGYRKLIQNMMHDSMNAGLVPDSSEVLNVEILHAVREEMAQHLTDVVLRRSDLGSAGYPGDNAINAVATIMAKSLKWNMNKKKKEINELHEHYRRMGAIS